MSFRRVKTDYKSLDTVTEMLGISAEKLGSAFFGYYYCAIDSDNKILFICSGKSDEEKYTLFTEKGSVTAHKNYEGFSFDIEDENLDSSGFDRQKLNELFNEGYKVWEQGEDNIAEGKSL